MTAGRLLFSIAVTVVSFFLTWIVGGVAPTTSLLVGALTAATIAVLSLGWYCITLPARIEAEVRVAQQDVYVVQQKRGIQETMRQIAHASRLAAEEARRSVIRARDDEDASVDVDAIHAQALDFASRALGLLDDLKQFGYAQEASEISRAVDATKPEGVEEAIAQLVELQRVLDSHGTRAATCDRAAMRGWPAICPTLRMQTTEDSRAPDRCPRWQLDYARPRRARFRPLRSARAAPASQLVRHVVRLFRVPS